MALSLYNKKRNFDKTPEPAGKTKSKKDALVFVVQKHHASHLHYDFRLQMEGVLKSWAVPKGPSMNPADKRLAMMVEDHPYDYKDFEGNIPEGNYGGGNVIVWDNGTYHAKEEADKALNEKALLAGLKKGHLNFVLKGKKLKGEFDLVKIRNGKQENAWLLIKKDDRYASDIDITQKDKSVISRLTLEALAKKYDNEKNGVTVAEKKVKKIAGTKKVKPDAGVKKKSPG
jgi:bifunctional non-homologous end joining protein LigD